MNLSGLILPNIDIPTLAVARAIIQLTLAGLILWTGSRQVRLAGARWWAAGLAVHGLALLVFTYRYLPLESVTVVINHLGFGLSSAFILIGFWRFAGRPVRHGLVALIVGVSMASLLLWEWWMPNARFRILTTASGQVVYLLALQALLTAAPRREMAGIYRALRWITIAYAVLMVWAYGSVGGVLPTTARVPAGYHGILFSVGSMLFMLSLAVGFVALQYAEITSRHAEQARRDWLTGLLNRRGLREALAERAADPAAASCRALLVIDADEFKAVNDRYGHAIGDRLLATLSEGLMHNAEPADLVARMGGEEFLFLRPDAGLAEAERLAEQLRTELARQSLDGPDGPIQVTVSIGLALTPADEPFDAALQRADQALYRAKQAGRNRVVVNGNAGFAPARTPVT
ncbi:GGDEF domain-containing protein [Wenzhouxiangella sp. XN79A]|uniref:GGDEF domain-containing protein n=1 Tax=Wenzhouxiangella sp. XN79A TaxID=2724193 RepID=UPI00144A6C03|nr:GGDEF domain-containing protein [Wenzhouxiangella sp. XN79A]NKI36333.1 GGDEF domain-containing protein [Wenzhouxiangella sp. XN79A]